MNGMNYKPFVSKVLDTVSDEDLATLLSLLNQHSNEFLNRSLVDKNNLLTTDDKGVSLSNIQLDYSRRATGYLVYNNSYCVLFRYMMNSDVITIYQINLAEKTYSVVNETMTVEYLRHEVAIRANGAIDAGTVVVNNITSIDGDTLSSLKAGDIVLKNDSTGKHAYVVSFKKDGTGICLTYTDASVVETVSYDFTGNAWVYNSTDITPLGGGTDITASDIDSESATSGQVLTANGTGGATWADNPVGMTNPMTTAGDIIVGGSSGAPTRLAKGTDGQVLTMVSGDVAWANASGGAIPTVTIALTQVVSQNPLTIQLTNEQYTTVTTNNIVNYDLSAFVSSMGVDYSGIGYYDHEHDYVLLPKSMFKTLRVEFSGSQQIMIFTEEVETSVASPIVTLSSANWTSLKTNHYFTTSLPVTWDSLRNPNAYFINTFVAIDMGGAENDDFYCTLVKNQKVQHAGIQYGWYSALFFIEESTHLYEIAVYLKEANSGDIVLRCATVY